MHRPDLSSWLRPNWLASGTVLTITPADLQARNIRGLVLDVDRTLLPRWSLVLPDGVRDWVDRLRPSFKLYLLSNNPSRARIVSVAQQLNLPFALAARKPGRRQLRRVLDLLELPPRQVAIVGDRLFTDVLAGNRMGMVSVLVRPIAADGQASTQDVLQRSELGVLRLLGVNVTHATTTHG